MKEETDGKNHPRKDTSTLPFQGNLTMCFLFAIHAIITNIRHSWRLIKAEHLTTTLKGERRRGDVPPSRFRGDWKSPHHVGSLGVVVLFSGFSTSLLSISYGPPWMTHLAFSSLNNVPGGCGRHLL